MRDDETSAGIDGSLGAMLGTTLSPEHSKLQQTCREFADEGADSRG